MEEGVLEKAGWENKVTLSGHVHRRHPWDAQSGWQFHLKREACAGEDDYNHWQKTGDPIVCDGSSHMDYPEWVSVAWALAPGFFLQ